MSSIPSYGVFRCSNGHRHVYFAKKLQNQHIPCDVSRGAMRDNRNAYQQIHTVLGLAAINTK